MDNQIKSAGGLNLMVSFLALMAGAVVLWFSGDGSASTAFALAFLTIGFLVSLVSYFHLHLLDREQLEQMEHDEARKGTADTSMFEADAFPARRTREQFDKWWVPALTIVLFIAQGIAAWVIFTKLLRGQWTQKTVLGKPEVVLAVSALFGLFLFLRGRYATVLARMSNAITLQPGSDFLLLGAYQFFLLAIAAAATLAEYKSVHLFMAWAQLALLLVLTGETLLRLILDLYRPRLKGGEVRQLYHSRLVGLISKPESFFSTAAIALDYQFGFKVSETWGYQFLKERLALLAMLQVAVLWISTAVVVIQPNEQGLIERRDGPVLLEPGIRFKCPWPFEDLQRYVPSRVEVVQVGYHETAAEAGRGVKKGVNWNEPRVKDHSNPEVQQEMYRHYFATRADQSKSASKNASDRTAGLLYVSVPVQFVIRDIREWTRYTKVKSQEHPFLIIESIATREVTQYFMGKRMAELLASGRSTASSVLLAHIQRAADTRKLGVTIINVGLDRIQPPAERAQIAVTDITDPTKKEALGSDSPTGVHEKYLAALLTQRQSVQMAQARSGHLTEMSHIRAAQIHDKGEMDAQQKRQSRKSEGNELKEFLSMYKAAPQVYPAYRHLEAMASVLGAPNTRKYVLMGTNALDTIHFDFKKSQTDILDISARLAVNPEDDSKAEFKRNP